MTGRRIGLIATLVLCACGTTGGPAPSGTPAVPTYSVAAVTFIDDNRDGAQNPVEIGSVPDAEIDVDGHTASSQPGTGAAVVSGVPAGTYPVTLRKLPPFFQPGADLTVTVPQPSGAPLLLPVTLPIGDNRPDVYLSSGDSISEGFGSSDGQGYRPALQAKLTGAFGRARIEYQGGGGGQSFDGARRIRRDLAASTPAFVFVEWGANDWNDHEVCADPLASSCLLMPNLQAIVEAVKGAQSLPCLATITPPNTAIDPVDRYDWVLKANDAIRDLAKREGALLVDIGDAFVKAGNPPTLFYDHLHPNDAGYALIADTYFQALTLGTTATAAP